MSIDRRQFLKGGIATAAGLVAGSAIVGEAGVAYASPRFAGDPGSGRVYYGANVDAALGGVPALENQLGHRLGVHRGYYVVSSVPGLIRQVRDDHAAGRFPHVSTKVPGTWADVAAGRYDGWLGNLLTSINDGQPVFLTLHHEPEDDAGATGMQASNFVAMQNHAISMARSKAPAVTIAPNLMSYTFQPHSGRDPQAWTVTGSAVFCCNVYNDWNPTNGIPWRNMGDKLSAVLPYANGRPIVIGEYGCHTDPQNPGRAATWLHDAFDWCRTHGVVSMSYFDSSQHSRFGSWVLDSERIGAMRTIIRSSATAWL